MAALSLQQKYRTFEVTSSSFRLVTDREQAKDTLRHFYDLLEPGGILIMFFMCFQVDEDNPVWAWEMSKEKVRPEDGAIIRRWAFAEFDIGEKLQHTKDRYKVEIVGEAAR
jgi:hypothetical protein